MLHGAWLSLQPDLPWAPACLLLQGLPPGTASQSLEQHIQALLQAMGHPEQACHACLRQVRAKFSQRCLLGKMPRDDLQPCPQTPVFCRGKPEPWARVGQGVPRLKCPGAEQCVWWGHPRQTCCHWAAPRA